MAKAVDLSAMPLANPTPQPRASQVPALKAVPPAPAPVKAEVPVAPLQIRIPPADIKAIKRAALEADQSVSEFMLACFHAYMKN